MRAAIVRATTALRQSSDADAGWRSMDGPAPRRHTALNSKRAYRVASWNGPRTANRTTTMTFQAYLDAVKAKTGKTPEQLKAASEKAGVYQPDTKATALIEWLQSEYGLGRGHSMSV